jgi:hypothetical protein
VFVTRQQSRIFGQLSGTDLAGGDPLQDLVGLSELLALPVLAAG